MQTSKKVKLIYDLYENNNAYHGFEQDTNIDDFDSNKIVESIKDVIYDKNKKLTIYSWGIMRHDEPKCEISFDLTKFTTKTDIKDVRLLDGRDEEIQNSIIQHPYHINNKYYIIALLFCHSQIHFSGHFSAPYMVTIY